MTVRINFSNSRIVGRRNSAISRRDASESCKNRSPRKTEGVGNAGCPMHPQPRVRMVSEAHERSHHRFTGLFPAFPHAMVLTAYFVLSPATNSSCHHRRRIKVLSKARSGRLNLRRLDTSNGARTTRLCHRRLRQRLRRALCQSAEALAKADSGVRLRAV